MPDFVQKLAVSFVSLKMTRITHVFLTYIRMAQNAFSSRLYPYSQFVWQEHLFWCWSAKLPNRTLHLFSLVLFMLMWSVNKTSWFFVIYRYKCVCRYICVLPVRSPNHWPLCSLKLQFPKSCNPNRVSSTIFFRKIKTQIAVKWWFLNKYSKMSHKIIH